MTAQDIMTGNVITVTPASSVRRVAQLLVQHRIGAVPVVASDRGLVGIVAESDLLHRVETGTERHPSRWFALLADEETVVHDYVKTHGTRVDDVMSRDFVTVTPETGVEEIARLLEKPQARRVVVVSGGRVVGIVTRADPVRKVATAPISPQRTPMADDDAIRQAVIQALRAAGLAAICATIQEVTVKNGVVDLWGWAESDQAERAACNAANRVPGVQAVEDHLVRLPAMVWAE